MRHCLLIILGISIFYSCTIDANFDQAEVEFTDSLSLFAEDIISTQHKERDIAISPDGNLILFTRVTPGNGLSVIMFIEKQDGDWTDPEIASFAGQYSDLEPAFSPDGKSLFFASNRPVEGDQPKDFDIWKLDVNGSEFTNLVRLDTTINTSGNEFYPSVSKSGNLYFTASYDFETKREDIYVSRFVDGQYDNPEPLPEAVCGPTFEFNAYISPDEDYIIYTAYGRSDDMGGGDLYINKKENGEWLPAQRLKGEVNSKSLDYCPFVTQDGKHFLFTSNKSAMKSSYEKPLSTRKFMKILEDTQSGNGSIYIIPFDQI
jgi:Tol biopolymer transport system component